MREGMINDAGSFLLPLYHRAQIQNGVPLSTDNAVTVSPIRFFTREEVEKLATVVAWQIRKAGSQQVAEFLAVTQCDASVQKNFVRRRILDTGLSFLSPTSMLCLAECIMIHNARSCLLLRPGSAHGHYMITLILPMQSLYSLLTFENKYQCVKIKSSPEFIGVQTCICYRDLSYRPSLATWRPTHQRPLFLCQVRHVTIILLPIFSFRHL